MVEMLHIYFLRFAIVGTNERVKGRMWNNVSWKRGVCFLGLMLNLLNDVCITATEGFQNYCSRQYFKYSQSFLTFNNILHMAMIGYENCTFTIYYPAVQCRRI